MARDHIKAARRSTCEKQPNFKRIENAGLKPRPVHLDILTPRSFLSASTKRQADACAVAWHSTGAGNSFCAAKLPPVRGIQSPSGHRRLFAGTWKNGTLSDQSCPGDSGPGDCRPAGVLGRGSSDAMTQSRSIAPSLHGQLPSGIPLPLLPNPKSHPLSSKTGQSC